MVWGILLHNAINSSNNKTTTANKFWTVTKNFRGNLLHFPLKSTGEAETNLPSIKEVATHADGQLTIYSWQHNTRINAACSTFNLIRCTHLQSLLSAYEKLCHNWDLRNKMLFTKTKKIQQHENNWWLQHVAQRDVWGHHWNENK